MFQSTSQCDSLALRSMAKCKTSYRIIANNSNILVQKLLQNVLHEQCIPDGQDVAIRIPSLVLTAIWWTPVSGVDTVHALLCHVLLVGVLTSYWNILL